MEGHLNKNDFKKKYKYSESTYQRRMKLFKKNPKYEDGYIAPTKNEIWIKPEIFDEFLKDLSLKRSNYQKIEVSR